MNDKPREYTAKEELEMLLEGIRGIAEYWSRVEGRSDKEKCDGVAFSILCILDGVNMGLPAYNLSVSCHEDNEQFHKENGENWHKIGKKLPTNEMWHDLYYKNYPL